MGYNILVLNIGSTSFKFKYYDIQTESILAEGKITNIRSDCKYSFKIGDKSFEGAITDSNGYKSCLQKILDFIKISSISLFSGIKSKNSLFKLFS